MTADDSSHPAAEPRDGTVPAGRTFRGGLHGLWHSIVGAVGLVMGLVPHVLHHVGLLAGTALVAGAGGTALFDVLGLESIPMLVHLYRRFGSWMLVFTAGMHHTADR